MKGVNRMSKTEIVVMIISALFGTGGITTIIVALLSFRKYKAEANLIEQQALDAQKESERKNNEYITNQLKELTERHAQESEKYRKKIEELTTQNEAKIKELSEQINALSKRVNQLMNWIIVDNNAHRSWLECELRKAKPDIKIPKCRPVPGFEDYDPGDTTVISGE
jgi:biopolymer transport protein ExbB/TolQ